MSEALSDTLVEEPTEELTFPATLPVLPLKDTVVFPESVTPLAIGQERSIKLVEDVVSGDRVLALVTVKNQEAEQPGWDDLYEVGTAAVIHKMIKVPTGRCGFSSRACSASSSTARCRTTRTSWASSSSCRTVRFGRSGDEERAAPPLAL